MSGPQDIGIRQRARGGLSGRTTPAHSPTNDLDDEHLAAHRGRDREDGFSIDKLVETEEASMAILATLTLLGFALRFYKINHPDQVVFDEVHFGKFASHYISREYYFDVHPPLTKMLFGLAGWFVGFDGKFKFENIGDSYTEAHVPYVGMRALPAFMGSMTIPIVYAIMKESGYSNMIAAFSACLILFDNAHIAQSRLILLDAPLIFFMCLTIYSYIRFRKLRYLEFSPAWWGWLLATGTFMACTWSSKVNGILTVAAIGFAVLIDLWDILDFKKGHSMEYFWKHFVARAIGLIALPLVLYLFFFYIHLSILTHSGPGDTFMSPAFQETLVDNELLLNSQEIRYYDTITLKHRDTGVYLHSHPERYPLKYEDGRISSQGQQVTGYAHDDTNNWWQVIPTKALPETGRGRIVRHEDVVQLLHVSTQTFLLTHDVASPTKPTNEEVTTWPKDDHSRHNDTLFHLRLMDANPGAAWKTKSSHIKLIHVPTKVALWTFAGQLPEWAFNQQEVNGKKEISDKSTIWFANEIAASEEGEIKSKEELGHKQPRKMNFFKKFGELQLLMLQHNAGLTASHPYASGPFNWPFLVSGISFWTQNEGQKQIYLIGNVIGWFASTFGVAIFIGILGADLLARRRGIEAVPEAVRNRLWNSTGFFLLIWAVHYMPFYLMGRQLFLHHYLPSHVASALVAGAVLSFVLSETINYPISVLGPSTRRRISTKADIGIKGPIIVGIAALLMFGVFLYISPLTYGTPGLTGEQVNARRLMNTWTLHFAAKKTDYGA